nr:MAG TPA: hypothetical protein [Caudoviricetes sp.]
MSHITDLCRIHNSLLDRTNKVYRGLILSL